MNSYLDGQPSELPKDKVEQTRRLSIEELALLTHEDITRAGTSVLELLTMSDTVDEVRLKEAWINYADLTEAFVDSFEDSQSRSNAQIAAIINKALIFRAAHRTQRYL
jgi:hypothetical protein